MISLKPNQLVYNHIRNMHLEISSLEGQPERESAIITLNSKKA